MALAVASPLNALVAHFLAGFTATEISGALQSAAVIFAIILGFIMPQLSNFLSMQRALTGTLKDALDLYHQRSNEVVVTIQRLEDLGISAGETVRDVVSHEGSHGKKMTASLQSISNQSKNHMSSTPEIGPLMHPHRCRLYYLLRSSPYICHWRLCSDAAYSQRNPPWHARRALHFVAARPALG